MNENQESNITPLNSYEYKLGYIDGQKHPTDEVISDIITQFMEWIYNDEIHGIDMQAAVKFIQENGRN